MKKIVSLLVTGILISGAAQAQWITGGPELGLNLSNLSTASGGDHGSNGVRPGLKIGGIVDIGFNSMFSIQPGLFYSMKGAHEDFTQTTTTFGATTTNEQKFDYRIDYLEIPVNFQFKFGNPKHGRFFAGAGPYMGFALGGKATSDNITTVRRNNGDIASTERSSDYNLRIGNNANVDDIKGLDMGLNINAGYIFPMGLLVRANYGQGLVNVEPGGDANNYIRNWGFTFSVAYLFGY